MNIKAVDMWTVVFVVVGIIFFFVAIFFADNATNPRLRIGEQTFAFFAGVVCGLITLGCMMGAILTG
jgi:hypothetical protein